MPLAFDGSASMAGTGLLMDKPGFPNRTRRNPNSGTRDCLSSALSYVTSLGIRMEERSIATQTDLEPYQEDGPFKLRKLENIKLSWPCSCQPCARFQSHLSEPTLSLSLCDCPHFPVSKKYIQVCMCVCMHSYISKISL